MPTIRMQALACAILSAVVVTPALAAKVHVDWDRDLDMGGWRTFTWGEGSIPPTNELGRQRVEDAILQAFKDHGMEFVEQGPTDFQVRYHAIVDEQTQQSSVRIGLGISRRVGSHGAISVGGSTSPGGAKVVEIGTLVVDVLDSSTGNLAWTAKGSETLKGDPDRRREQIDKALKKALAKFPPK